MAALQAAHVLAALQAVQDDAQALRARLLRTGADGMAALPSDVSTSLQQTLQQLRQMQAALAAQQARLDGLADAPQTSQSPWQLRETALQDAAQQVRRAEFAASDAAPGVARAALRAEPAATGIGAQGDEADMGPAVQIPAGEREGLDGIVATVGGMLRAASGPTTVGKMRRHVQPLSGQARPESDDLETLQRRWGTFVAAQKSPKSMDINQLIQWVMREAYVGNTDDLRNHATRVEYYTSLKKQIRAELTRAREFRSTHRSGEGKTAKLDTPFGLHHIDVDPDISAEGDYALRPLTPDGSTESLEEMDAYIKKLDNLLSTVGDDSQMAQLDLQNLTQKQAQALNMLSNLSKVMHDTAMSILRKIGS
jgi:hypothetical protein